jgi:hypothetical protein
MANTGSSSVWFPSGQFEAYAPDQRFGRIDNHLIRQAHQHTMVLVKKTLVE